MGIKRIIHNVGRFLIKNSPIILSGVAVIGVGTTTYLAVKAAPEVASLAKNVKLEPATKQSDKENIVKIVKKVAPAAVSGAITVGAMVGSTVIFNKRCKGLEFAYNQSRAQLNSYKSAVVGALGAEAKNMVENEASRPKGDRPDDIGEDIYEFVDTYSGDVVYSTLKEMEERRYKFLKKLTCRTSLSYNAYRKTFTFTPWENGGDELAWDIYEIESWTDSPWLDIALTEHETHDRPKWYSIDFSIEPTIDGAIDLDVPWYQEHGKIDSVESLYEKNFFAYL